MLKGTADEAKGVVETACEFGSDHVITQGFFGTNDPFGEPEDKVAFLNLFGDLDQVFEQRRHSD